MIIFKSRALSRGHTSDFLLAQVMRFFQILSRRQRERVATRVTNSSEFGDKLNAAWIAYFKRPGAINRHGGRPFRTRILFYRLFAFLFLTIKSKRREKKIKKRWTWVRPWLGKRKEQGFYYQLLTEISVVDIPAFPELLRMTRLSCRVATRALSLRFCRENFNSGNFFLAIFFHLSRRKFEGGYTCNFHLALATRQNLKKITSPARAKNRLCGRGFMSCRICQQSQKGFLTESLLYLGKD